jgi:acetyl esterase/lipase
MDGEGANVARWLNEQGFAAIVLKYRLYRADNSKKMAPMDLSKIKLSLKFANANPAPDNHELNNVIRLATADGQQAIRLVRRNAEKWKIDPSKIGIMGFSAGGGVAVGTALLDDPQGYPDFVVSLYGPSMVDVHVPANAPPLFIAVAANHKPVSLGCIALYSVWNEAGKSAELHVFSKGRGGFGIRKQGLPSDAWPDLFLKWLKGEGLI